MITARADGGAYDEGLGSMKVVDAEYGCSNALVYFDEDDDEVLEFPPFSIPEEGETLEPLFEGGFEYIEAPIGGCT